MALWGSKVKAATPLVLEAGKQQSSLSITRAALASGNSASLSLQVDDKTFFISTLTKDGKSSCALDINIWEYDVTVKLSVAGDGEVHLTGYNHPSEPESFDDEESGDEEADEELLAALAKKGKKGQPAPQPAQQPAAAKKQEPKKKKQPQAAAAPSAPVASTTPAPANAGNNNKKRKASGGAAGGPQEKKAKK
eukprot:TRINITY_DN2846_c0_g1_i1.p1 TRINITY_DN2846_c0_g1~~TRINITY_DN2846_c0_g1_i1.p1  ORF type:complete len:193 (+),score=58.32 TRINITY_DN2846_c0_g1_i1:64-642(+)